MPATPTTIKVGSTNIASGASAHQAMRRMIQFTAAVRLSQETGFTDNSTGVSGAGTISAITVPVAAAVSGTNLAPKAGLDAALVTVQNALRTEQSKITALGTILNIQNPFTYNGGGTDGNGTIAAITKTVTAVDGTGNTGAAYAGTLLAYQSLTSAISSIVREFNKVAIASGYTVITDNSGGSAAVATVPALVVNTGTGVTGSSAVGATASVTKANADAMLVSLANAVATIAAATNAAIAKRNATIVAI